MIGGFKDPRKVRLKAGWALFVVVEEGEIAQKTVF